MDVVTMKKDLENQIGDINKELENIYLPHEAVLILLGKRTALEKALAYLEEQKPAEWSEDERRRKNCIHFLELQKAHHADTSEIDDCIAYLEKRKELTWQQLCRICETAFRMLNRNLTEALMFSTYNSPQEFCEELKKEIGYGRTK